MNPETEQGRALFQELLWVHSVVRRDLETVRRLAAEVVDGLPAEQLNAELNELQTKGPLWPDWCIPCKAKVHQQLSF